MDATAPTVSFLLRQPRLVQCYREVLAADQLPDHALTMVWIPPGRFWMGSPPSEVDRSDAEGPQHLVQLQGLFMGQTPITQAQWRAVAGWKERQGERWGRELEPEPSFFQPRSHPKASSFGEGRFSLGQGETNSDHRPVENVSWLDVMEFCSRLSQRTGRHYTLPSEAQWEYACRAGSDTPFAFGATLTAELANYEGQQTTPVGMFPANAWGLQDMHGNVWEWCLDRWHDSYEGAPTDGSAWQEPSDRDEERGLLRGGSWYDDPGYCRSAFRGLDRPDDADDLVGLRVVCLPQGPSLNAETLNPSTLAVA
jgi:formylglycine-generating enzyme required for sulfatase activity